MTAVTLVLLAAALGASIGGNIQAALERRSWRAERSELIRVAISKHAGEAVAIGAFGPKEPKAHKARNEDDPPPGTQPVGLDGF